LIKGDPDEAVNYCKGMISDLRQNRIDLSLLVITKGLGKRIEDDPKAKDGKYANK
jgi:DNA polymerase delta subunit 1